MAYGLLTKQEAKDLRDIRAVCTQAELYEFIAMASDIALVQQSQPDRTFADYNWVTRVEIAEYFTKAPYNYTVVQSTSGLPAGQTRITKISW